MSMEVISPRSALLSNYEVLTLLRELESEQLVRQKTAIRVKKEEEERVALGVTDAPASSSASLLLQEEVFANLRTVEVEAIQYLTADYQPTKAQSPESISQLVRGLASYDLTKAEKLQIVNLVPTERVELYVIVEEIEDRLGENMDEVLDVVRKSLSSPASEAFLSSGQSGAAAAEREYPVHAGNDEMLEDRPGWENAGDVEEEFDDLGMGAGVEGDLEMDDD